MIIAVDLKINTLRENLTVAFAQKLNDNFS